MNKPTDTIRTYWRTLHERNRKPKLAVLGSTGGSAEFPPGADELVIDGHASRRKFIGILSASAALAGVSGCGIVRKPKEQILPFAKRPEDMIPGEPMDYATGIAFGGTVLGLIVETVDGRPIKVEGNPLHSGSLGATDAWAQASILDLYDPDRSRAPKGRFDVFHFVAESGESEDDIKKTLEHDLCAYVERRTLASSNSLDAAKSAAAECAKRAESQGVFAFEEHEGKKTGMLTVPADSLVDSDYNTAWTAIDAAMTKAKAAEGEGLALVVEWSQSPTFRALVASFRAAYPKARLFLDDPMAPTASVEAATVVAGADARTVYDLTNAGVILALDSDFLGTDTDHVRLTAQYAAGRRVSKPGDSMSRLYSVEPFPTVTGAQADHRLRLRSTDVADFAQALIVSMTNDLGLAPSPNAISLLKAIGVPTLAPEVEAFAKAVAKDLAGAKGRGVVIVGDRQPAAVHALGLLINEMIGAFGRTGTGSALVSTYADPGVIDHEPLAGLAAGLGDKSVKWVVALGTNPAYRAPGSLRMREALANAELLVHFGTHCDETGQLAHWHVPLSHEFEAWGDLRAFDGTTTIQQPLIAPLFDSPSAIEVLARLVTPGQATDGAKLVRDNWAVEAGAAIPDDVWARWLHDGIVAGVPRDARNYGRGGWTAAAKLLEALPAPSDGMEVSFYPDYKVLAGRFSNNAWMQEFPHPTSKLVWDNAAYVSPGTARKLGVKDGEMVSIKVGGVSIGVPAWIQPGQADFSVTVTLGYGRQNLGEVAEGAGVDVYALQTAENPWFAAAEVSRGAGKVQLVSTQDYGSLDPDGADGSPFGFNFEERPLYRETTVEGYVADPNFAKKGDLMPASRLHSLFEHPAFYGRQQWGMVIDLNSCTGCGTCTIACQAENNIPVVGKKECANGREMHWIRIDRYFRGDEEDPQVVFQPVTCQHCENAPCETVCPVAATVHSPDGLNDMAYNRCIGTRYCANNCPYKVRRFNFFNYNYDIDPVAQMQKNPDVTVRFRGVMEKCSYCVQRINQAKIDAHVRGEDLVADGVIQTACQQACPAKAITFGDVSDEKTEVSKLKARDRNYTLLADLNTSPRTSFLGRVRNLNSELKDA